MPPSATTASTCRRFHSTRSSRDTAGRWSSCRAAFPDEPGDIVVDPQYRNLYLVQAGGTAIRYGIGVGRAGFAWSGKATIRRKEHWPTWTPPKEMVARDPSAAPYAKGMKGGLRQPARRPRHVPVPGQRDTLYRIHGTNDPSSIGKAVSSGCIRMIDQDVMDLYERTPIGTKVIVLKPDNELPDGRHVRPALPAAPPARQAGPGAGSTRRRGTKT